MKWISVKESLPEKSGEYLIAATHEGDNEPYYYSVVNYSARHRQFNNDDCSPRDESGLWDDVTHWAEIEVPEVDG